MKNNEMIKQLDKWEEDIKTHLKYMKTHNRVEACLVLSNMIEFKEKLKKECEEECQLEAQV